jgi:hypothetical protein
LVGAIKELWFEFKDPNRTIEETPSALGRRLERLRRHHDDSRVVDHPTS